MVLTVLYYTVSEKCLCILYVNMVLDVQCYIMSEINFHHFKTNFHHLHQILIFITKRHDSPLIQFPPSSQISVNQRSCTTT